MIKGIETVVDVLDTIYARCETLADMHSDNDQDRYAVPHPQMKQLYKDIAFIAKSVAVIMDRK